MTTPIPDAAPQNISVSLSAQSTAKIVTGVIKSGGSAVDFTAGSWLWQLLYQPQSQPTSNSTLALTNFSASGSALGVVTADLTNGAGGEPSTMQSNYSLRASNDAGVTYMTVAKGLLQISYP